MTKQTLGTFLAATLLALLSAAPSAQVPRTEADGPGLGGGYRTVLADGPGLGGGYRTVLADGPGLGGGYRTVR